MHGGIVQFMDPSSCQHHDIHRGQSVLLEPDGFTHDALETVSVDGPANIPLAEDQAQSRVAMFVGRGQCHQTLAMDLECSRFKDTSVIPGSQ